eukprot:6190624-Pleurochrysis_carterae.AAC.4
MIVRPLPGCSVVSWIAADRLHAGMQWPPRCSKGVQLTCELESPLAAHSRALLRRRQKPVHNCACRLNAAKKY